MPSTPNEIVNTDQTLIAQHSGLLKTGNAFSFRDLNKNGQLDIYEDPRQPIEARAEDLLAQMTVEEKAELLFINGAIVNADGSIEDKPNAPPFPRRAMSQISGQR